MLAGKSDERISHRGKPSCALRAMQQTLPLGEQKIPLKQEVNVLANVTLFIAVEPAVDDELRRFETQLRSLRSWQTGQGFSKLQHAGKLARNCQPFRIPTADQLSSGYQAWE